MNTSLQNDIALDRGESFAQNDVKVRIDENDFSVSNGGEDYKPSSSAVNLIEDEEITKKAKRSERNRISARQRRMRKNLLIKDLQKNVVELTKKNSEVRKRNDLLKQRLREMKSEVKNMNQQHHSLVQTAACDYRVGTSQERAFGSSQASTAFTGHLNIKPQFLHNHAPQTHQPSNILRQTQGINAPQTLSVSGMPNTLLPQAFQGLQGLRFSPDQTLSQFLVQGRQEPRIMDNNLQPVAIHGAMHHQYSQYQNHNILYQGVIQEHSLPSLSKGLKKVP